MWALIALFWAFVVLAASLWIVNDDDRIGWRIIACSITYVSVFLIGTFSGASWLSKDVQYKVTIDDSVSWNDVNELYDVIDVDGDIVTLTIKEE